MPVSSLVTSSRSRARIFAASWDADCFADSHGSRLCVGLLAGISPGGSSPKGIYRPPPLGGGTQDIDFDKGFTKGIVKKFRPNLSVKNRVLKLRFLAFPGGPGGFRELREAGRNRFHLSWYLLVPGITSYCQKPSWGIFFDVLGII